MNLKHASIPSLILLLSPSAVFAEILAAGGKINLSASLTEAYSSNAEGRAGAGGSYTSSFSPSIAYSRDVSLIATDANLSMSVVRDFQNSQYNQETYNASTSLALAKGTLGNYSVGFSVNYSEGASANYDIGQRVASKSASASLNSSIDTSERTGLDLSSSYTRNLAAGFSRQESFSNSVDFHFGPFLRNASLFANYSNHLTRSTGENELNAALDQSTNTLSVGAGKALTEKLNARANVGYSWFDNANALAGQNASKEGSLYLSASLTGPFLPSKWVAKTSSTFSLSYADSYSRGLGDSGGKSLTGSLNLNWQARENTSVFFSASRSRQLTVRDTTSETTSLSVGITERLYTGLSLSASVGCNWNTYVGSTEGGQTVLYGSLSAAQSFGKKQNWSAGLSYSYRTSSSSTQFRNFSNHTATASIRYSY